MWVSRLALRIKNFNYAATFCRHYNYHSRHVYAWYSMQNLFAHIQGILTTLWDKVYYGLVRVYWWFILSSLDTKIKVYTIQTLMFGMFHATHLLHETTTLVEVSTPSCILRIFSIHQVWFFYMHFSFLFSCFVLTEIMTLVAKFAYVFVETWAWLMHFVRLKHRKKQCGHRHILCVIVSTLPHAMQNTPGLTCRRSSSSPKANPFFNIRQPCILTLFGTSAAHNSIQLLWSATELDEEASAFLAVFRVIPRW